jgi:hypothetical protein
LVVVVSRPTDPVVAVIDRFSITVVGLSRFSITVVEDGASR